MADFTPGDVVVLKSGSMRMLVERIDGDAVAVVWANDGGIGRDTLPAFALNRWEHREERPAPRAPFVPRSGGDEEGERPAPRKPWADKRPYGDKPAGERKPFGDRKPYGDKKPFGDKKPYGDRKPAGERPARTGMDGKPRTKTFFRDES